MSQRWFFSAVVIAAACSGRIDGSPEAADVPGGSSGAGVTGGTGVTPKSGSAPGAPAGTGPSATGNPGQPALAVARVRRLTATEVLSSARDVFLGGDATALAAVALPPTVASRGFDNLSESLSVDLGFMDFLEDLGAAVSGVLAKSTAACAPGTAEATCAAQFVQTVGRRAYRRPLTSGEASRLSGVFATARQSGAAVELALGTVAEAMIHSPNFLYRTELGAPEQAGRPSAALTPYEVASELSYFMWQSAPDEPLLQAAAAGQLSSSDGIAQQAARMITDPRTRGSLRSMFLQWLDVDGPEQVTKTTKGFTPAVADAMVKETALFVDDLLWNKGAALPSLFTSTTGFANKYLAPIYGVASATDALAPVTLDPGVRAGVLTQAGFIAAHTPAESFIPIHLGLAVRNKFLCQILPLPPPQVPEAPKDPELTTREKFAVHSRDPGCAGCHALMDPIGFGFEKYGVTGQLRQFETVGKAQRQVPLTGAAQLTGTDVDGSFAGPVELGRKLASSAAVKECFAAQMLEYALGRSVADPGSRADADVRALGALVAGPFQGGDIKKLLASAVGTDVFRLRDASQVPGGAP